MNLQKLVMMLVPNPEVSCSGLLYGTLVANSVCVSNTIFPLIPFKQRFLSAFASR